MSVVTRGRIVLSAVILVAVAAAGGGPAMAQHSAFAEDCKGLANVPTAICFDEATQSAEVEMNKLLSDIRNALEAADQQRLEATQQAWLRYSVLSCDAESSVYFQNTGHAVNVGACRLAETRARIGDLHLGYDWRVEWMRMQK